MDTIEIALTVKRNGEHIASSPFIRRVSVDESQSFAVEQATGAGYVTLPITSLDQLQFLLLRPDQQVTVRMAGQTNGGVVVNAGGLLLVIDAAIAAVAATNATVDNSSGSTVVLQGMAGGT